jgi:uncharacterized membrane protein
MARHLQFSALAATTLESGNAPARALGPAGWLPSCEPEQSAGRENPQAEEAHRVRPFRSAETHARSVLKAVSWRTLGTIDTFAISWFMTGRVVLASSIAGLEVITKVTWYYLHERVWAAISWGRREAR